MIAWLFVAVLAASAAAWVLAPLFRDDAASAERVASVLSEAEDLQSQREMALSALRDLEDDRATGKIGDADYEDLRSRLTATCRGRYPPADRRARPRLRHSLRH